MKVFLSCTKDGDIFHCVTRWFPFYRTSPENIWVFTHSIVRIPVSAITAIGLFYIHITVAGKNFFIRSKIRGETPKTFCHCMLAGALIMG